MSSGSRRGVTLLELIISMSMFGLLLAAIFLLFGLGSRGLRTVETRQTAQNQLAAVRASLQSSLQVTHFYGVAKVARSFLVNGVEQTRDALSAVALADWNAAGALDAFGVPEWNRWVVFRVTNEEKGQLVRHLVKPDSGSGRALLRKADHLDELSLTVSPNSSIADASSPQILARGVRSFRVKLDQHERTIQADLTIEQKTDHSNPKPDVLTATFYIKPHNTVPTD